MSKKQQAKNGKANISEMPLPFFACPNPDCAHFNGFDAGNLSVVERMGMDKAIRRLYCKTCDTHFGKRRCKSAKDRLLVLQ